MSAQRGAKHVPPADTPALRRLIGRRLMVGVRGATPEDPVLRADLDMCAAFHVKGVILFDVDLPVATRLMRQGVGRAEAMARSPRNIISPAQTRALTDHIRERLGADCLVGVDQEGGDPRAGDMARSGVARLSPIRGFPPSVCAAQFAALGAEARVAEAERLASMTADAGFTINFAPCVDISINPDNPIIAHKGRHYGEDARSVVECARMVMDSHARRGVLTCLKHFPGHGSSSDDSHAGLPDITRSFRAEVELAPYRALVGAGSAPAGAPFVMTGHLLHRGIDADHPASLSRAHTTGILRREIGFSGAIVTDSLDMGAITKRYGMDEALILALNAGADVLLDCNNGEEWRACPAGAMSEAIARGVVEGRVVGGRW